ncbi:DDE_3 domain-containing protein [Trichonephila clavipes]|nr:DDE_3 domain-containing protein [Trichonephila clavipes]
MNPGLFWGQMITVYVCGGALVSGTIPPHCSTSHCPHIWCNGLGAIAYDSRSTLIVVHGTLTGQRCVDDILRPHVGPFLNGLPGAIFQQDNARPYTARVAQDFLHHFQTLPWPAHSLDLFPVEQVWDELKRQMPSCHSVHDLELAVQDLWGPSASGQHKGSNQLNAGPCGGMYCSWRWSNTLLKLPSICVIAHPVFV